MPTRTAAQLIATVRGLTQHWQQSPYRDGFAADLTGNEKSTSILSLLNQGQEELLETGYSKCTFTLTTVANQQLYGFDPEMGEILTVYDADGVPLTKTSLGRFDTEDSSWRSATASSTLSKYFTYGHVIGFVPPPSDIQTVKIVSDSTVADLTLTTSVPERLPSQFHNLLAIFAALQISYMDMDNEAAQRRIPGLQARWHKGFNHLQRMVQQRDLDESDTVYVFDYREEYAY